MEGLVVLLLFGIVAFFIVHKVIFFEANEKSKLNANEIGVMINLKQYLEDKYDYSYNGENNDRGLVFDHYYWIVDMPLQNKEKIFGQDDTGRFWDINRLEEVDGEGNPIKHVFRVGENEQNYEELIFTCKADYMDTNGGPFGIDRNYYSPSHNYQFTGEEMRVLDNSEEVWWEFIEEQSERKLTYHDDEIILQKHGHQMININNIDDNDCLFRAYAIKNGPVYYKEILVPSLVSKPYLWWVTDKIPKKEKAIAYEDSYGSLFYVGDEPNVGYCKQFMGDKSAKKKIKIAHEEIFRLYTKRNSGLEWIDCEDLLED